MFNFHYFNNETFSLPKILKRYIDAEYGIQLRVRFLYRLIFVLLISLLVVIAYTSYLQLIDPNNLGQINEKVLISEASLFIFYFTSREFF